MSRFFLFSLELFKVRNCSAQKVRSYSSLWTGRAQCSQQPIKGLSLYQQNRSLFRSQHRIFSSFSATGARVWILGVGVGSLLALWLKDYNGGERCECKKISENNSNRGYDPAIEISRDLLQRVKDEVGAPGIVIGVSVDGVRVWCEGLGYADLENRIPCCPETVMRIASISKPLTTAAVGRLWETGKLDLDVPLQKYVPEFPEKQYEGETVSITTRMLLSHLSGIRHYEKDPKKVREDKEKAKQPLCEKPNKEEEKSAKQEKSKSEDSQLKEAKQAQRKKEFEQEEYYLKRTFHSVLQALDLFKDDPLIFKPGTTFLYSTHAFTLLSAVVERVSSQPFLDHMMKMFRELGMLNTVPDENDPIIYNRSRFYHFGKKGRIVNCPYVDNSYKWAGGGFLSTVGDLLLFGNAMLYSYQIAHCKDKENLLPGFLKPETARMIWAPVEKTEGWWDKDGVYGMGWLVVEKLQKYGQCRKRRHYVSHTGGAVGASSVLLVLPNESLETHGDSLIPPQGVVVTIITNMQSVGLNSTALKIAYEFDKARGK